MDGHLVLVGLPGAGKSTIGRLLARKLGRPFLDFDHELERRTGKSVQRIFAELGESEFRRLEVELTRELAAAPPMVLAPGGGWITNEGVIDLLRPPGYLIHLRVTPEVALRRLLRSKIVRPLLKKSDPGEALVSLWEARSDLYGRADHTLDVETLSPQQVTDRLLEIARDTTKRLG